MTMVMDDETEVLTTCCRRLEERRLVVVLVSWPSCVCLADPVVELLLVLVAAPLLVFGFDEVSLPILPSSIRLLNLSLSIVLKVRRRR